MNVEHFMLSKSDWIPNNETLPVIVYRQIAPCMDSGAFEDLFLKNGWTGTWRNGVFDYHHYHSSAHEVLGIGRGHAALQIGGSDGPVLEISPGDCLVLPAGTGHKRLNASPDFQVVGAYPPDQEVDIQRSAPTKDMLRKIKALATPTNDPVEGSPGALQRLWGKR
ncbi:cupin [Agrobacterium sp. BA1120]|uniref:cupin n=1 Tax=Agrobacterium sp. BA1120 TaxID=3228927 RepID=UPI003369CD2B